MAQEEAIGAIGEEIFLKMGKRTPNVFSRRGLDGRLLQWSMNNEQLKIQLFRFIDVLPGLTTPRDIAMHAAEYLSQTDGALPAPIKWAIRHSPKAPWLAALIARKSVERMANTFIVARDGAQALPRLRAMRSQPLAFTVDLLGETVTSESEAETYQRRYLELIDSLTREASQWETIHQIDMAEGGPLPRVNVSVKLSSLYSRIVPADPDDAVRGIVNRLLPILQRAREYGAFINLDMEQYALKDITLQVLYKILSEFPDWPNIGIAMQAYLKESERDLDALISFAREQKRRVTVRLIKGAYWDYETIIADQKNWPTPVFQRKAETDANYERLARKMLGNTAHIDCAFGTHNVRSIAACIATAQELGLPMSGFEFQMLYGMAEPSKEALIEMGYRVREYCPVGEVLPGMSYLVRRLLENTSNEGFLRAAFEEHASVRELLQNPAELISEEQAIVSRRFNNDPPTDFGRPDGREKMQRAMTRARSELGKDYPLIINGKPVTGPAHIVSVNPACPKEIIGRVSRAGLAEGNAALAAAKHAFREWKHAPVSDRAGMLRRAADVMRRQRFDLAALEILETGKPWAEADADVAEAIDFCDFYALEMERLEESFWKVAGEENFHHYIPRGLAVIIAPWNFPLAILCGMTTAALVTGNCAIIKPSEQSCVIGARFMQILEEAGLPPGVANFLPGRGAEIGEYLVKHPDIALIAFTGSREVGLRICEAAGHVAPGQRDLKKVICEMGGKNSMIIDSDADLDEAIPAILTSAFGYAGQKCSALSRLIVLEPVYEKLLLRLIEAAKNFTVGSPELPGTLVGPVIDDQAHKRILQYIEKGKGTARLVFQGAVPESSGYFVPPTIFADVPPGDPLAREEIFGPVLSVFKAATFDEAIAMANDSQYALTGGLFSRSPSHIKQARAEMEVGNLYINRQITGALVGRHPFGGFKMSGGGTKAGGQDYLLNFMFPRCITENTVRRGFAAGE